MCLSVCMCVYVSMNLEATGETEFPQELTIFPVPGYPTGKESLLVHLDLSVTELPGSTSLSLPRAGTVSMN